MSLTQLPHDPYPAQARLSPETSSPEASSPGAFSPQASSPDVSSSEASSSRTSSSGVPEVVSSPETSPAEISPGVAESEAAELTGRERLALRRRNRRRARLAAASDSSQTAISEPDGTKQVSVAEKTDEIAIPAPDPVRHPSSAKKLKRVLLSAFVFVGIPTIVAGIYFGFIASDQYVSRAIFAIRSPNGAAVPSVGLLSASIIGNASDMSILQKYILSRQMLEDIKPYIDLRRKFSNPNADWLARLDPSIPEERFLDYWQTMVTVTYDQTSGLTELDVHAFTAEDAKEIADRILILSEALVNRLSERARADTLALTQKEVDKAYMRLNEILRMLQYLPRTSQQFDAGAFAKVQDDIKSRVNRDLVDYQKRLDDMRKSLPENSPSIQHLNEQIAALKSQLSTTSIEVNRDGVQADNSPTGMLQSYDRLMLERGFAEQIYTSALAAQEAARVEAMKQDRYLEAFVRPQLPQYAELPRRIRAVVITAVVATLCWAIGSLLVAATKEHL